MSQPSPFVSAYPFPTVKGDLFPPVCLTSHWDPTKMLRHILPTRHVTLPEDFRPLVKVCMEYKTSAPTREAPLPPADMVFPMGGGVYPPGRYSAAIDQESVLRTLDQRLDRACMTGQYVPSTESNLYNAGSTLPDRKAAVSAFVAEHSGSMPDRNATDVFVAELSMPQALLRNDGTTCRSANDTAYFERSGRLFHNPTKQDRYGAQTFYAKRGGLPQGAPMPHGGVNQMPPTSQARRSIQSAPAFSQPGGAAIQRMAAGKVTNSSGTSFVGIATSGSAARVW
jgi:hypothetical protein